LTKPNSNHIDIKICSTPQLSETCPQTLSQ
jgi:hypothetical protein